MEIVNVVASGSFNQLISFQKLMKLGDRISVPNGTSPRICISLKTCKVTVYKSGKYIIKGISSFDALDVAWYELTEILQDFLNIALFEKPQIKNILAKGNLDRTVSLRKLYILLKDENVEYEPEVFPGLIWKTEYGTVNLFSNGKMILLGCKSMDELKILYDYIDLFIINSSC